MGAVDGDDLLVPRMAIAARKSSNPYDLGPRAAGPARDDQRTGRGEADQPNRCSFGPRSQKAGYLSDRLVVDLRAGEAHELKLVVPAHTQPPAITLILARPDSWRGRRPWRMTAAI